MPILSPVLDDRSFDQIRNELLDRIPVYNPDWTDRSRSDPAVTLLELFAFLGEGLQFRFNQIPEATQLAFLKLLNQPLRPAQPATALVRAVPRPGPASLRGVSFYGGDQLKAGRTLFTVDSDAPCWPIDCVAVARQPAAMPDATTEPELHAAVQGTIDAVADTTPDLSAITTYQTVVLAPDGSTPPVDFTDTVDGCIWIAVLKDPTLTLDVAPGAIVSLSIGVSPAATTPTLAEVAACPGDGPASRPSMEWRATAPTLTPSGQPRLVPIRVTADTTQGFSAEGVVRVDLPADLTSIGAPPVPTGLEGTGDFPPELDDPAQAASLWFWLRVWRSDNSRVGALRGLCVNALPVTQAIIARPELLGNGTGQPGQVFSLAHSPVLLDAQHGVTLEVEESGLWTAWRQRDDLDASTAADRDFTVDAEAGTISFGARGPQVGERVRVTTYRYGGGLAGNVPAKAISALGEPAPNAPPPAHMRRPSDVPMDIGNPFPATGGADSESVEEGLKRIPGELRRRNRAVTSGDFAELALLTPGVALGRAECLPLFHAPDQAYPWPGAVSVVIWPDRDPVHPDAPVPDAYQLRQVCRWLDQKRLATTELYVIPPTYRGVAIALSVKVKDGFGLDAVRNWVELVLRRYLSPLPPYGPDGNGWPLGRRVLDRELEGVAMQVDGVEYVQALAIAGLVEGAWQTMSTVAMQRWEVPTVAGITIVDDATALPDPGSAVPPPPAGKPVPIPVLRPKC